MVKVFFEGAGAGILIATALIVFFEIKLNYALGDKIKDFFLSEEAKLKSLKNKIVALVYKADAAALVLIKKKK